jgi:hypothetical protein
MTTTAAVDSPNGIAQFYVPSRRPRWAWVEYDGGDEDEEPGEDGGGSPAAGFRAEVRCNLTFGEIDELGASARFDHIRARLAPYVREWNLARLDPETGAVAPIPPPAVDGAKAFAELDPDTTAWLWRKVMNLPFGGPERGKGSTKRSGAGATSDGGA